MHYGKTEGRGCFHPYVLAMTCFLAVALLINVPGQASIISIEQLADSVILTVYEAGEPAIRRAGGTGGYAAIARLAEDAGVELSDSWIALPGDTILWEKITISARIRQPSRGWLIHLDTLATGEIMNDDRCMARTDLVIPEDEFIFGSLFNWHGKMTISGEVGGDVICFGGPVNLLAGAVVRGNIMVIGGKLDQRAPAKAYGGVYSDIKFDYRPVEVSHEWQYEGERYGLRPTFSYDKVDGARPGVKMHFQDTWTTPKVGLWTAYAFESKRWQYQLFFEQRLSTMREVLLGGEYTRMTDTEDRLFIYSLENSLVAILANEDYRDYFGRQGGRLWTSARVRERHTAMVEYENFDYRWRDTSARLWSLFWTGRDFRRNFGVLEGVADELLAVGTFERKVSLLRLNYRIVEPERDRYVTGVGYRFDGFWEIAGGALKGDWEYNRVFVRGAVWYEFAGQHRVLARGFAGKAQHNVPAPKLFYLGGPGSLRGYRVKQFAGDEVLLATVEYAIRFWKHTITDASLVLFYDFGRASYHREFWVLQEFRSDIGVALDFGGGFRLAVAKALEETDIAPAVTVRVKAGL